MAEGIRGTDGYAAEAADLLVRYEAISFAEAHSDILHLLPEAPGLALDIGSGTGRDAAHLAGLGHRVVAVEPTDSMRIGAARLHPSNLIEWIDDGLPDLARLAGRKATFDLVMMTAVWMHLDAADRRRAMPVVGSLLRPGGTMIMTLRHGPVPAGRRMFEVSVEETVALARDARLSPVFDHHWISLREPNKSAGVTWTRLAFSKVHESDGRE
ncbi:MAG: class I SAM-dependent methyltransferase [Sphingomonadales bacterium]